MFGKKFNYIAIVIILFISVVLGTAAVTAVETTDFATDFMDGCFVGNVELRNDSQNNLGSFVDSENGITYNLSTVDDTNPLIDIYKSQGIDGPNKVTLNGNDWNIYFSDAVPEDSSKKSDIMNIIICQSQDVKQGYLIYVIIDSKSDYIQPSMSTSSEAYTHFVKPLLESVTLKESNNVPKINEELGLTET